MKKIVTILLSSILIIGTLAGCGSTGKGEKGTIDNIKERGVIKIGVFTDKPPFGYINENGENDGLDVILSKRFAKDLLGDESKVEFVPVEAAGRIPFLQSDKVDIIMANLTVTDERKEVVDFANPYMKVSIQVLANDNENIKSTDDLKGKKLIVVKGTTADILFTKNYPDIELLKFDQNTEAFQALKDGRGVAMAHDNLLLYPWAKKNPGFSLVDQKLEEPATIAPAVKKGNDEMREWINQELNELGKEQFLHKVYEESLRNEFGDIVKSPEDVIVEGGKL